jgi:Uma2 family endonuclease
MSTTSLMTFGQFEQLPDLPGKQELIDGELILMPPAKKTHSIVSRRITKLLLNSSSSDQVRVDGTGYRIGPAWIVPDASVMWPNQPEDENYYLRSPMLAVEILSENEEIARKLTLYFAQGALEVWVIDPKHKTMTVHTRSAETVIQTPVENEYTWSEGAVTIRLADLFAGF